VQENITIWPPQTCVSTTIVATGVASLTDNSKPGRYIVGMDNQLELHLELELDKLEALLELKIIIHNHILLQ
jgi:hypothetical protein